ncbi:RNA polymerase I-specific transcription initiation factor RRN6-like protein [Xylaria sp. FL1042]|nr:RNA polymerase I-specific transcription initiation factor RRN6-like protein [Xylaria sp. FL1042]
MTERRLIESTIGLPGCLSHIPYGTDKAEDCGWRSSRNFTRNAPIFRTLSPSETWISAEPNHIVEQSPIPGTAWEQRRRQQRWLVKHHPEASLGNHILHDCLVEDSLFSPQQGHGWHTCFFSLGQLTDTSTRRNTGVPLVVTVTGSANNVLRLARLDQGKWTWPREPNVAARLVELSSEKPALWIDENVGPIRRVKCIVDLTRYNPTRWLAVQRDSGTTVFQPEYRKAPVNGSLGRNASRIAANPLFRLSKEQTGGNSHSDVSFNPATRSNPPQIAIIDERGFWSIWDVKHNRLKTSGEPIPRLRICGHIDRGVLEQFPYRERSTMKWHKILWVGRSEDNLDLMGTLDLGTDDNEDLSSQAAFPSLQRSSSVLVCNSQQVRLFDLITRVYLPDLQFCSHDGLDCILDIQITHDPQCFYVLTTSKLFIVRIYSTPGVDWDRPVKKWSILFSTPHYRSSFDQGLKLTITQGAKQAQTTSLVFIYSPTNPWIDLFCVEFSPSMNEFRCQANVTAVGSLHKAFNGPVETLCISPTLIMVKTPKPVTKIGRDLAGKRIKLYQIIALRSDMSLVSTLCVSSSSPSIRISIPSKVAGRRPRGERQRDRDLQSPFSEVAIDDSLATPEEGSLSVTHRYIEVFFEHLSRISVGSDQDSPAKSARISVSRYNPFDVVHEYIEEAVNNGLLSSRTLLEVMPDFKEISKNSLYAIKWESEIEKLNNIHPNVVVFTLDLLHSRLSPSITASPQDAYSTILEITNNSLHHGDSDDANERRIVSISEQVTYDLYLSLYGIGYRNPNGNQPQATVEEDMPLGSQNESLPSSPPRFESPASSALSQRSNSEAAEDEDPAMTLLRAYTGTGKFVPDKKFELLDKWKLGAKPADYVFDLDRSSDMDEGKLRRARQQAREDRKRRRTQTLIRLSQEPELPATQPAPDISFYSSQPRVMSSQRQIIHSDPLHMMMSQPTAGAFGRRPAKKAKKRKGGF